MIIDRIEEMRKKSYGERRRTTFLISLSITAVIGLVWGTVVLPRTLTLEGTESSRATTASPFQTLTEDLGIILGDIQIGVGELGKQFNQLRGAEEGEEVDALPQAGTRDESAAVDIPTEFPSSLEMEGVDGNNPESVPVEGVSGDAEASGETQVELDIEG